MTTSLLPASRPFNNEPISRSNSRRWMKTTTKMETVGLVSLDRRRNSERSLKKLSYFEFSTERERESNLIAKWSRRRISLRYLKRAWNRNKNNNRANARSNNKKKTARRRSHCLLQLSLPFPSSSEKYSALDWTGYFDEERDVSILDSDDVFHVYMAGTEGPVVFFLHGGGCSGISFAMSACIIKEKAQVVAMDMRGRGKSSTENDLDLSVETMCNDVFAVVKAMYGDSPPAMVLVGHSMGGSVAVHVAAKKTLRSLAGLVVVDVVEGTAMAALIHMQEILSSRMQHFSSIEKAIEWSVKGDSFRNIDSARISIPSTLKFDESKNWYEGLSEKFRSSPVPKLLLLAGIDRLDRLPSLDGSK